MIRKTTLLALTCAAVLFTACSDSDDVKNYDITLNEQLPAGLPADYTVTAATLKLTELNTASVRVIDLKEAAPYTVSAGTYNAEGNMTVTYDNNGTEATKTLRATAQQVVVSQPTTIKLDWFYYNPSSSLVFSELYTIGSLNATGKGSLYDSYFRIYNNTDETIYADGLAICESQMNNTTTNQIQTPEALPTACFTVQTVYVIPGNGTQVPVLPGQSIKIADQAIDWTEQVPGALDHRDADFEWYDEVTIGTLRDTDNPSVPNLDKWFSYSATIWIPNQQCISSFALVKFPAGMTADKFLSEYNGEYTYVNSVTGNEMTAKKCYRVPLDWILDGVNLCPDETYTVSALAPSIDMSYAAISDKKVTTADRGKKFVRKVAATSPAGNVILQDTNDSASDFEVVSAK